MTSKFRRSGSALNKAAIILGGVLLGSGLVVSPAVSADTSATTSIGPMASSRCLVGNSGNCTTAIIRANATGRFVDIFVDNIFRPSPCPWRVRDVNNGVIVRSGTVATNSRTDQIVQGLYSVYQLELRGCSISAEGYIDNT